MTVKPSRGTVVFFLLLGLGLLVRYGLRQRDEGLLRRDTPRTETARRLYRCMLGNDIQRALWPRPEDATPWETVIAGRLHFSAMAHYEAGVWPSRCVPLLDRLLSQLGVSRDDRSALTQGMQLRYQLNQAAQSRMALLEAVENRTLARSLAQLALSVSALSDGAQDTWAQGLPPAPTDLAPRREQTQAHPQFFPEMADSTTLSQPDLALFQNAAEGRLHSVLFDAQGRMRSDRALGDGAPVRGAREGAVRVAADATEQLYLPAGQPSQLVPLPEPYRSGARELGEWQWAQTATTLWLFGIERGALSAWRTPREGLPRWESLSLPAELTDGTVVGVLPQDAPAETEGLDLVVLRRTSDTEGSTVVRVERWSRVVALPAPPPAPAPGRAARATRPNTAPPAAPVRLDEWAAFHPRVRYCSAGNVRYALVGADDGMNLVRLAGSEVSRRFWVFSDAEVPSGNRLELSCQRDGALVFMDLARERGVLWSWTASASERGLVRSPPRFGVEPQVVAAVLTETQGILALVSNRQTVRSFFTRDLGATWTGGDLVLLQSPRNVVRFDAEDSQYELRTSSAEGDRVGILADAIVGRRVFTVWLGSHDGGRTWL